MQSIFGKFSDLFSPLINQRVEYNTLCMIQDWNNEGDIQYYFLREISQGHMTRKIGPYQSVCFGFSLVPYSNDLYEKTIQSSTYQMIQDIKSGKNNNINIDSYDINNRLKDILIKNAPIKKFLQWMTTLTQILSNNNVSFNQYISQLGFIKEDEELTTQFFKYCLNLGNLINTENINSNLEQVNICKSAQNIFNSNLLGPICFLTPELGAVLLV